MAKFDKAINVQISDEEVTRRLSSRRTCSNCRRIFNKVFNPPKVEEKCDVCGSDLIIRDDDKPEVIADRLKIYHEQTEPIIEYYRSKGILIDIDGEAGSENVFAEILEKLGVSKSLST